MSAAPVTTAESTGHATTTEPRLQSLPPRTCRFRGLGLGMAALPLIAVVRELDSPPIA